MSSGCSKQLETSNIMCTTNYDQTFNVIRRQIKTKSWKKKGENEENLYHFIPFSDWIQLFLCGAARFTSIRHPIWPSIAEHSTQWTWIEVNSALQAINTKVIGSVILGLMKTSVSKCKKKTQRKDQKQWGEVWSLLGFLPLPLLWPGATEQCVRDEHEGASSSSNSSVRQGPPCHWHSTSKTSRCYTSSLPSHFISKDTQEGGDILRW